MTTEMDRYPKVLVVDDNSRNLLVFEAILKDLDLELIKAESGKDALLMVLEHDIALILLDVQMPEMTGYEVAQILRSNEDTRHIPIIFITAAYTESKDIYKGYKSGAIDYLLKPVEKDILRHKVSIFLELFRHKKAVQDQNIELEKARTTILAQQESLIEEERMRVVLQLAGAAAHELSQPLMILMGSINLMEMDEENPHKAIRHIPKIKDAGTRLSRIVNRIQIIDSHNVKAHDSRTQMLDFDHKFHILYVEDNDVDFQLVNTMMKGNPSFSLARAVSIKTALDRLSTDKFDIVLLDWELPDGNGMDILKVINREEYDNAVVFISSHGDDLLASNAVQEGAHDYMAKCNLNQDALLSTLNSAIEKKRLRKTVDAAIEKMAELSTKDELTGLYNRRYMNDVFDQEFKRALRYETDLSCLIADLDLFKQVNDTYGHDAGDYVLKCFARLLQQFKRGSDYVFRFGGEEFLILLPQTDLDGAYKAAELIRLKWQKAVHSYKNHQITLTTSIGIASVGSVKPKTVKDLTAMADKALYQAKASGRNCVRIFEEETEKQALPATEIPHNTGLTFLKEQIGSILEKTKQASIKSLELLLRDLGGEQLEKETLQTVEYIRLICSQLNLPQPVVQSISQAASLNGCFRILLGEELLSKTDGLNESDKAIIESIPYMQVELATLFDFFNHEKAVLLYNHEHYDGQGYPERLKADEIPIGARIFAVANAVTAMTADRPYRKPLSHEAVLSELVNKAGRQFDPALVKLFIDVAEEKKLLDISDDRLSLSRKAINHSGVCDSNDDPVDI